MNSGRTSHRPVPVDHWLGRGISHFIETFVPRWHDYATIARAVDAHGNPHLLVALATGGKPRTTGCCGMPGVLAETHIKRLRITDVAEVAAEQVDGEGPNVWNRWPCTHCVYLLEQHAPWARVVSPHEGLLSMTLRGSPRSVAQRRVVMALHGEDRQRHLVQTIDPTNGRIELPVPYGRMDDETHDFWVRRFELDRVDQSAETETYDFPDGTKVPESPGHAHITRLLRATARHAARVIRPNRHEVVTGAVLADGTMVFSCAVMAPWRERQNLNRCGEPSVLAKAWMHSVATTTYAPVEAIVSLRLAERSEIEIGPREFPFEILRSCATCCGALLEHAPQAKVLLPGSDETNQLILVRAPDLIPFPYPRLHSAKEPPPLAVLPPALAKRFSPSRDGSELAGR